jgi:uncharacterized protein (DUF1778 family)
MIGMRLNGVERKLLEDAARKADITPTEFTRRSALSIAATVLASTAPVDATLDTMPIGAP